MKKMEVLTLVKDTYEIADAAARAGIEAINNSLSDYQPKGDYALKSDIPTNYVEPSDLDVYALKSEVPTKTSTLTNDSGFITVADIPEIDLTDYALKSEVPTKTSTLTNDSGFITAADIPEVNLTDYALKSEVPTKTSSLTNDSGFITAADIPEINLTDYATKTELEALQTAVDEMDPENVAATMVIKHNTSTNAHNDIRQSIDDLNVAINERQPAGNYATVEYVNQKFANFDVGEVPTKLSDLSDDENHRLVTDADKTNWNNKANVSAIPTALSSLTDDATHRLVTDEEKAYWNKKAEVSDIPTLVEDLADGSKYATIDYVDEQVGGTTKDIVGYVDSQRGVSVSTLGAVGDGSTDDTYAFQTALAENRRVFVPGGTYVLSDTLPIRENCCLELSQDTVLKFTQTSGNCITMRGSATLKGNHAVIWVPYAFTDNVIDIDTLDDGTDHATSIPPYTKSSPQFKRQRFVYDINIVKPIDNYGNIGFCSSSTGDCNGTGIYISATNVSNKSDDIPWMWALTLSGIRIAGAFSYGIHAINYDSEVGSSGHYTDDAWNHDMRIEAVIEACEIGVALENCNGAHLQVTVQPNPAVNGTKYAKHGVYLNDARFIDMTGSRIWDWNERTSLWTDGGQYQHIAMLGNCRGLILDDFLYYETGYDIRSLIYTDRSENLEQITILQEPITRWFKPVGGKPYFFDGGSNKEIQLKDDKITPEQTGFIIGAEGEYVTTPDFTNLASSYQDGYYLNASSTLSELEGYVTTDYIPIDGAAVHVYRIGGTGITWDDSYGYCRIAWYNADKTKHGDCMAWNKIGINEYYPQWVDDDSVVAAFSTSANNAASSGAAYFKVTAKGSGANLVVTVDEEQTYTTTWEGTPGRLDETVYAQNVLLTAPNGTVYKLAVDNDGTLSSAVYS